MRTIKVDRQASRFTALLQMARAVGDAPAGQDGVPCVMVGRVKTERGNALFARTGNPALDVELVLDEKEESLIRSSMDYLTTRLKAIGFKLVNTEQELPLQLA